MAPSIASCPKEIFDIIQRKRACSSNAPSDMPYYHKNSITLHFYIAGYGSDVSQRSQMKLVTRYHKNYNISREIKQISEAACDQELTIRSWRDINIDVNRKYLRKKKRSVSARRGKLRSRRRRGEGHAGGTRVACTVYARGILEQNKVVESMRQKLRLYFFLLAIPGPTPTFIICSHTYHW